ncbi:pyruvate kinase [Maribacter algarum]|uniref:Pyruvate kinase n=1 Tax=Maribacter algarum (ex Zhang et al. 2020) TaxID=2578118 RepID=A0A5S3PHK3_9FLAO|nr:pyruvate kinase [Maribacter algarum]TMM53754.1 pyruvate kinase [Maribacter algarum]
MRELEVGDKVYNVKQDGFGDFARYSFSEVVKLTKTLAILKNGVRLYNQPRASYIIEDVGYCVSRQKGVHWHLLSLKAIRKAQIENEKIAAYDWFESKEFTLKEKMYIYEQFKKLAEESTAAKTHNYS